MRSLHGDAFFVRSEGRLYLNKYLETNYRIRDKEVRVLDESGEQLGIMSAREANALADKKNLDLVKISPNAKPPVCKIMDYGKYKFEQNKRDKEVKKNQVVSELKEVWLSMTIEKHDLETKAKHARKFLVAGNKVKVLLRMRGRQQAHSNLGVEVMQDFFACVEDVSIQDKKPSTEGRAIVMILSPKKATSTTPLIKEQTTTIAVTPIKPATLSTDKPKVAATATKTTAIKPKTDKKP